MTSHWSTNLTRPHRAWFSLDSDQWLYTFQTDPNHGTIQSESTVAGQRWEAECGRMCTGGRPLVLMRALLPGPLGSGVPAISFFAGWARKGRAFPFSFCPGIMRYGCVLRAICRRMALGRAACPEQRS